jgi:hypothetical protein
MDADLAWIDEAAERAEIDKVHEVLRAELGDSWPQTFPADISHDLNVARFLRGNGNRADKAAPLMAKAVSVAGSRSLDLWVVLPLFAVRWSARHRPMDRKLACAVGIAWT